VSALKLVEAAEGAAQPAPSGRDLPIDFLRGVVLVAMTCVHVELTSAYSFLVWERVGVLSSAEGFVILSGVVLGMVSRRRIERRGFSHAAARVIDRGAQLYRANVVLALAFLLLTASGLIDTFEATHFTNRSTGEVWPTFPSEGTPPQQALALLALLRMGPHQTQVLGLYVCVMFLTPIALWLLHKGRTGLLMGGSFVLYSYYQVSHARPTSAQFEYAFPLLAWQLLFFGALAVGYHREAIRDWLDIGVRRRLTLTAAAVISLACLVFAWCADNPHLPEWASLGLLTPETYGLIYDRYCQKSSLGLLRVTNNVALLSLAWWGLHRLWPILGPTLGRLFVPIGQASLYVFLVHVFVVTLIANVLPFGFAPEGFWANTLAHTAAVALLYAMVKRQVLYRWIPR